MNSVARSLLTIYLVIATLAAVVFGYLYFKDKKGDPFELTMAAVEEVILDVRNTIEAGYVATASVNSVQSQGMYVNAGNTYDVTSYFNSATKADLNATIYNTHARSLETYVIIAQCFVSEGNEFDKLYTSTRSDNHFGDACTETMLFKVKKTGELQVTISAYSYKTREADNSIVSYTDMEWTIQVQTGNYDYIIEAKVAIDGTYTGTSSQLVYMNFAKAKDATQFAYLNYMSGIMANDLETVLSNPIAESSIQQPVGGLFDFGNKKQVLTTDKSVVATALDGLKPYIESNAGLKNGTATPNDYYEHMANILEELYGSN